MDVRRALEVLGLSGPASRDGLRRAYLKAVRAHGPERDPRGFAEVRAAYELLQSLPWLAEACEFASEVDSPAPESARARLEQKPPPSWRAPVASSPPARPSAVPPAPTTPANVGFVRLFAEADYAGAARHLLCRGTAGSGLTAPPSDVLTCTLQLFEAGEFALAVELLREFEVVTERAGIRPSAFGLPVIARWMLLSELATLPGKAGAELITAFACAMQSGRYRRAGRVLVRALAADASLMARLRRFAPALLAATPIAGTARRTSLRPALSTAAGPP